MNKDTKLISLQYLRVFAALSVIFFHIEMGINSKYWVIDEYIELFNWGQQGVRIFFCLSGFVISYSSYIRPKKWFIFLYSRIVRIYPAYLFTVLLVIVSYIFLPYKSVNITDILNSIFFNFGISSDYVYVGWSLFYEMIFYIIFSFIINNFQSIAKNDLFIYFISILLTLSYLISAKIITDFIMGITIFLIKYFSPNKYRSVVFITLVSTFLLGIVFSPISFLLGILLFIMINSEEFLSNLFNSKLILFFADISYSIYLAQVLSISASLKLSRLITLNTFDNYIFMYLCSFFTSIISTITLGIILRKYVEIPSYNFLKKIT